VFGLTEQGKALAVIHMRLLLVLVVIGVAAGAFFVGRDSVEPRGATAARQSFARGYLAGREDVFLGYDGGWGYAEPYIIVLRRGGPGITYRIARRWPMQGGIEYRACAHIVCSRAAR
jgi:hypothetical protein